jgi:hypothetical protein
MNTVLNIMVGNLGPEKDPEVRLKFFTMLARTLLNYKQSTRSSQFEFFVKQIVEGESDVNYLHVIPPA